MTTWTKPSKNLTSDWNKPSANPTGYLKTDNNPTTFADTIPTYDTTIAIGTPIGLLLALTYANLVKINHKGYKDSYSKVIGNNTNWTKI